MFEALNERLTGVFDRITGRGALSEKDVAEAMREVRVALLEADVALPVVKDFIAFATERATGEDVIRSVKPADQVVKIVYDGLIEMLGGEEPVPLNTNANPPAVVLMAGLQGSGKTTTSAKLALRLTKFDRKKVMMASLDTRRPAAMEQLATLGQQIEVATLPIVAGESAVQITRRALQSAKLQGFDVLILDTAGRITLDEGLMNEVAEVAEIAKPVETLLVADSLTGQDAVRTAKAFHERLPLTGLVLTRADGDGRGGAMLSMRAVTGKPIRFVGLGEKMDALEVFDAQRIAGRILGMGDIVALVEKAQEVLEVEQAERMMKRFQKGLFNMNDLKNQLEQMIKMGGMQSIMGMMPGMGKMAKQAEAAGIDDTMIRRQIALINSMTKKERANPDLLQASRKKRIAAGAGMDVAELNKLLKMQRQMADTMKKVSKMGKGAMLKQAMRAMSGKGGGLPDLADVDPAKMAEATKMLQDQKGLGGQLGGLNLPGGLSGLFGKK